jgi:alkylhydroperoxidase family enzyme
VDINSSTVLKRGGSEDKLNDLKHYQTSSHFTEKEKVTLEYSDAVTYSDRHVTDELFTRLKQHYSDVEISELTGLIAFQNLSSKYNASLDVQPQGFCQIAPHPKQED